MALTLPHTPTKRKTFNAIRRTADGMLYLTTIDPNSENTDIEVSTYFEPGSKTSFCSVTHAEVPADYKKRK